MFVHVKTNARLGRSFHLYTLSWLRDFDSSSHGGHAVRQMHLSRSRHSSNSFARVVGYNRENCANTIASQLAQLCSLARVARMLRLERLESPVIGQFYPANCTIVVPANAITMIMGVDERLGFSFAEVAGDRGCCG